MSRLVGHGVLSRRRRGALVLISGAASGGGLFCGSRTAVGLLSLLVVAPAHPGNCSRRCPTSRHSLAVACARDIRASCAAQREVTKESTPRWRDDTRDSTPRAPEVGLSSARTLLGRTPECREGQDGRERPSPGRAIGGSKSTPPSSQSGAFDLNPRSARPRLGVFGRQARMGRGMDPRLACSTGIVLSRELRVRKRQGEGVFVRFGACFLLVTSLCTSKEK